MTRRIQDEAAASFDALFLAGKGDAMPPIDALSLFYDFRELTPIGRRGDEMIRKLADRLVSVDLLDQAAELLQHQVDHRLQGAARAQVAARLAVIYLMDRKPDRALQALRATRTGDLPNELRNQRLLLEARALSDIGRPRRRARSRRQRRRPRGRAAARRHPVGGASAGATRPSRSRSSTASAGATSRRSPTPERADMLRAAIGFALGEDAIGLDALPREIRRQDGGGAGRARVRGRDRAVRRRARRSSAIASDDRAAVDTLDQFLRDMRAGALSRAGGAPSPR